MNADAPLRANVRLLGDILGRVLVEQEGEELLADEERIRAALAGCAGGRGRGTSCATRFAGSTSNARRTVLRAFALYFQLANIAEQHHRVAPPAPVRARGADAARVARRRRSSSCATAGVERRAGDRRDVSLELVLTAHPTEATRRTHLAAHLRIARPC